MCEVWFALAQVDVKLKVHLKVTAAAAAGGSSRKLEEAAAATCQAHLHMRPPRNEEEWDSGTRDFNIASVVHNFPRLEHAYQFGVVLKLTVGAHSRKTYPRTPRGNQFTGGSQEQDFVALCVAGNSQGSVNIQLIHLLTSSIHHPTQPSHAHAPDDPSSLVKSKHPPERLHALIRLT